MATERQGDCDGLPFYIEILLFVPLEKFVKLDFVDHCSINEPMVSLDHWFDVHRISLCCPAVR